MKAHQTVLLVGALLMADLAFPQTWTQSSAPAANWTSIASSADGTKLFATVDGHDGGVSAIYSSTNSGLTWMINSNAPNLRWYSTTCSADGSKVTAVVEASPGAICTSTNFGALWIMAAVPSANWASVASSADGNKLVAVAYGGGIYASTNSGATWDITSAIVTNWYSVASSADGSKLAAVVFDDGTVHHGGQLYVSSNSGTTWNATSAPLEFWQSVASSADGKTLVASTRGQRFYSSTDGGLSWITNSLPNQTGYTERSVALSADGRKLVGISGGGTIYTSTNLGATWASNSVASQGWRSVASSADGNKLAVVAYIAYNSVPGQIYTLQCMAKPPLTLAPTNGNFALSWTIPSTNFVLQQSSDLVSWADVTNSPVINLTNLQNQVTIPPSGSHGFYRLKTP